MGLIDNLKDAVGLGGADGEGETWNDRIGEAAYTPPSGLRITFDFEDLSARVTRKTSVWMFPDAPGAYVQDYGPGSRRYPMRVFFWGKDCDKQAEVFQAALDETGAGKLDHPRYGELDVVPVGEWTRQDNLTTAANQVVFDVEFFATTGVAYPSSQEDFADAVQAALDAFGSAGDAEFATQLDQGSVAEQKSFLDDLNDAIDAVGDELGKVAAVQDVINDEFQDYVDTLNNAIDTFVQDPLTLAQTTRDMIQAPGRALANIAARLEGFGNLAQRIFTTPLSAPGGPGGLGPRIDSLTGSGNDAQEPNRFHLNNLVASSAVSGSVLSVLYTGNTQGSAATLPAVGRARANAQRQGVSDPGNSFRAAGEAIEAADTLLTQLDSLTTWRDNNFESISGGNLTAAQQADFLSAPSNMDLAGAHNELSRAVALAAGYLVELSFSLKRKRTISLDRARSIPELVCELYGTLDQIDFFVDSNDLTGDEIIELPAGKEVSYYV